MMWPRVSINDHLFQTWSTLMSSFKTINCCPVYMAMQNVKTSTHKWSSHVLVLQGQACYLQYSGNITHILSVCTHSLIEPLTPSNSPFSSRKSHGSGLQVTKRLFADSRWMAVTHIPFPHADKVLR